MKIWYTVPGEESYFWEMSFFIKSFTYQNNCHRKICLFVIILTFVLIILFLNNVENSLKINRI